MQLHRILKRQWPQHLVGVLAGKARAVFVDIDPMAEYGAIKDAVLTRFEVTPEASQIKLREMKYDPKADPNDLLVTLRMRARRWLLPVEAVQDYGEDEGRNQREDMIVDRVVKEQFLNMVPRQAREWLVQQKVETSGEMAQRLREYKLFQRENTPTTIATSHRDPPRPIRPRRHMTPMAEAHKSQTDCKLSPGKREEDQKANKTCYKYRQRGHFMRECKEEAFACKPTQVTPPNTYTCTGWVNGRPADIKLDTQCSRTLVNKVLVDNSQLNRREITLCIANGEIMKLPLADVKVEIEGETYHLEVGVSDKLPAKVLLGRDVDLGIHIWNQLPDHVREKIHHRMAGVKVEEAQAVVT